MIITATVSAAALAQPVYQAELISSTAGGNGRPAALSSSGVVAGDLLGGIDSLPAIWIGNTPSTIGSQPGSLSAVSGDGQWLAGTLVEADFSTRAVRMLRGGGFAFLSPPGVASEATGINAQGITVGSIGGEAVVWDSTGGATTLRLPGGTGGFGAQARAISNGGQVTGTLLDSIGTRRAFSWTQGGGVVALPGLGGVESRGNAVNSAGWIVGAAERGDGSGSTAVLWRNGAAIELDGIAGSEATGVNALGMIIGNDVGFTGGSAWLWLDGQRWALDALVGAGQVPSGFRIDQALAVNDLGEIVVRVIEPATLDSQYMLLRPVPGPASAGLMTLGALAAARRRRN
jgi:hypothetical protein